jgi:phosphotriesterase-related protein
MMKRRKFVKTVSMGAAALSLPLPVVKKKHLIMTVQGPAESDALGFVLSHEHILVDFIGADQVKPSRYKHEDVIPKVKPYLQEVREAGCNTLMECTPNYLGRDPLLLKKLAADTGLKILTNTGYYGARENKFIPEHAFQQTPAEMAAFWIGEWKKGIEGTGIKPGFIKIGIDRGPLSDFQRKLVEAACITHLKTGLTIAAHTGTAEGAFDEMEVLQRMGVHPSAWIWVHAQAEKDLEKHIVAAKEGAWISLDGVHHNQIGDYVKMIRNLKDQQLLHQVLISHDAGWYRPGEPGGGEFRGYLDVFTDLIPALQQDGFSRDELDQLFRKNPVEAFGIRVRKA